jgi:hypothetical protein
MGDVQSVWPDLVHDTPCPIRYTEEEKATIISEAVAWQEREDVITELEGFMHVSREGSVFPEKYEPCKELVALAWEKLLTDENPEVQAIREIWPWERS